MDIHLVRVPQYVDAGKCPVKAFDSNIRLFRLSTSAPMDIHLVRVPQDVDVVR